LTAPSINILLHGATGRMGRSVASVVSESTGTAISGVIELRTDVEAPALGPDGPPVLRTLPARSNPGDVVIDFTRPAGVSALLGALSGTRLPVVCGTTGITGAERELLEVYSQESPVFYAENMSYGISVIMRLLRAASPMFEGVADMEIVEFHHRGKADFPSGTAAAMARVARPDGPTVDGRGAAAGPETDRAHIHSVRIGGIPGDHQVHFAMLDEVVTLSHRALSRNVFAPGALSAARFIVGRDKGLYTMNDLVEAQADG
jgi:4-hydroxy-tetrahydrodipicolinate reductase